MTRKQFLIFTFVVLSITAHIVQWAWHKDLKNKLNWKFEYLCAQTNIINNAAIKTDEVLKEHLKDMEELNKVRRMQ